MTTEALAPFNATPFAELMPWLTSLWQRLRSRVDAREAAEEEAQILHLIEFAAWRFGAPLLRATSPDDLDDRLDELVDSPELLHCDALLARYAPPASSSSVESSPHAQQIVSAWGDAQRQASARIAHDKLADARRSSELSLASPDLPADLAEPLYHGLRAGLCSLAITRAIAASEAIEPWLAEALTERLGASAQQHLRLLASLPGIAVDDAIVPRSERIDLEAIFEHHQRARATSRRSLEAARTRLGM